MTPATPPTPSAPPTAMKSIAVTVGWAVGLAAVVTGVGLYMSDVPTPKSMVKAAPNVMPANHPNPVQSAANDLQNLLRNEADPHLLSLKKQLAIDPNDVESLLSIGILYVQQKEYSKAKGYYLRAAQVAPKNLEARTHLGTVAYFLGDVDEALHHYDEVLALNPDYTVALFEMGAVLRYGKGDLQAAVDAWQRFLALDPDAKEADQIRQLVIESKALLAKQNQPPQPLSGHPDQSTAPWPGKTTS